MKKKILVATAATLGTVAAAVPLSAWLIGIQVEKLHNRSYAMLDDYPNIRIVERSYDRGLFTARERVTYEIFGDSMRAMLAAREGNPAAAGGMPVPTPVQFSFQSEIRHGPYLGSAGLGLAAVDSELAIDGPALQKLSMTMDGQNPLRSHAVIGLTGNGSAAIVSPEFQTELSGRNPAEPLQLTWGGANIDIRFSSDFHHYTMRGAMPHFELADAQGGYVSIRNLSIDGDQTRIFPDEPMLYGGSMKLSIAKLKAQGAEPEAPAFEIGKLDYEVDAPVNGEFIDLTARLGAATVQYGERSFGPAHYDFSLKHLHGRSFANLVSTWMKLVSNPAVFATASGNKPSMAVFAPMAEPAMQLLRHDPEFRLDRLSFNSSAGEAKLSAKAVLKGVGDEDFRNPAMLLGKLDAAAELSLPESLVGDFLTSQASSADDTNAMVQRTAFLQQRLDRLEAQGILVRDNGTIRSRVSFSKGQLTVNDQPFSPASGG